MSMQSRLKCSFPLRGDGLQGLGGRMSTTSRHKGEFPLGGTGRRAKGVA